MSTIVNILTEQFRGTLIVQLCTEVMNKMDKKDFAARLVALRQSKGVSARDMSLSLGQSAGYINNIENGLNYPSMTVFFYICDYLGITPQEFFDTQTIDPTRSGELLRAAGHLRSEQLEHLIAIAKGLK